MTTPIQAKVYSNDNKIFTGMTLQDIGANGNKTLNVFNFADRDSDGKISEEELIRYNNPILVENKNSGKAKIIQDPATQPNLNIEEWEVDFYVGQKSDKLTKEARETFLNIDTDENGEISKEELVKIIKLQEKMDELDKDLFFPNLVKKVGSFGAFGAVLTGTVALALSIEAAVVAIPVFLLGAGVSAYCGKLTSDGLDKLLKIEKQLQEFGEENKHPYVQANLEEIK